MDKQTALLEERAKTQKKLEQLQNQQKILLNKQHNAERRARNHRLIVHGAILEGAFPAVVSANGEIVKEFLTKVSLLPGARELQEKMLSAGDEG